MMDLELTDIYQEPKDYRGSLVYRQEYGYKTVTMMISVVPNEQSHVISHTHYLPLTEEAKHIQHVDLYHFAVTDGHRYNSPLKHQQAARKHGTLYALMILKRSNPRWR